MISVPGWRSSPSETSRMSLFAQAALCRRSMQRLIGSLKSLPPLNTCAHALPEQAPSQEEWHADYMLHTHNPGPTT